MKSAFWNFCCQITLIHSRVAAQLIIDLDDPASLEMLQGMASMMLPLYEMMTGVLDELTQGVEDGQYASPDEVTAALETRLSELMGGGGGG